MSLKIANWFYTWLPYKWSPFQSFSLGVAVQPSQDAKRLTFIHLSIHPYVCLVLIQPFRYRCKTTDRPPDGRSHRCCIRSCWACAMGTTCVSQAPTARKAKAYNRVFFFLIWFGFFYGFLWWLGYLIPPQMPDPSIHPSSQRPTSQ